jgi:hypothetical protein
VGLDFGNQMGFGEGERKGEKRKWNHSVRTLGKFHDCLALFCGGHQPGQKWRLHRAHLSWEPLTKFAFLFVNHSLKCLLGVPANGSSYGKRAGDQGLPEASKFIPIPQTWDRSAYRELYYSQVPGYIFICAWDSHLLKKKLPHIWPKKRSGKMYCWTTIQDDCSECMKWLTERNNNKIKLSMANCRKAIFGGLNPGPLPTEFTQP